MRFGTKHSEVTRLKLKIAWQSRPPTTEKTKRKLSIAGKGENNPFYGKKHTENSKNKMREAHLGLQVSPEVKEQISRSLKARGHKPPIFYSGTENYQWKGEHASYSSVHKWVSKYRGKPHFCEHCKKTDLSHRSYNWANKSHQYKRDLEDWIRLCIPCHKKYDAFA